MLPGEATIHYRKSSFRQHFLPCPDYFGLAGAGVPGQSALRGIFLRNPYNTFLPEQRLIPCQNQSADQALFILPDMFIRNFNPI